MKVSIVPDRCCGSAMCVEVAPETFDLNDDGFVVILQAEPPAELQDAACDAAVKCPTMSIVIEP